MITNFYVGGDTHGVAKNLYKFISKMETPKSESAIILLGDVGFNYFGDKRDEDLKDDLNNEHVVLYCLRGNHEFRPSSLPNIIRKYDPNVDGEILYEPKYPYIRYFLDEGCVYYINDKRVLTVPGAYSVDKEYRVLRGWRWFKDEQLSYNEMNMLYDSLSEYDHFDYILSHTCPLIYEPDISFLFMDGVDQTKVDKSTEIFLNDIIENFDYGRLYFGHFHANYDLPNFPATMLYQDIIPLGETLHSMEIS